MIPQAYINEWYQSVPWQTMEQVEQDLVISRVLAALFSDAKLAESLAFRGGTALHKLYLFPQQRYSEDIDLVQLTAEPFGPIVDRIRERLSFLGAPRRSSGAHNFTLYYDFDSEFPPSRKLRLKLETNTREHFHVTDLVLRCFREYMAFSTDHPPGKKEFILNLEAKITDPEFLGDIKGLLRSDVNYDPLTACAIVKSELIDKI